MKLLLGCRDTKPYLVRNESDKYWYSMHQFELDIFKNVKTFNGKIVVECDFEVEEIKGYGPDDYYATNGDWLIIESGLGDEDINKYLKGKDGYAIHIKNLNTFKRPDEKYFYYFKTRHGDMHHLNQTPKNMIYVYDIDEIKKILLYLYPEELCNILNGKQTIIVRRTVLKEMLEPTGAERQ